MSRQQTRAKVRADKKTSNTKVKAPAVGTQVDGVQTIPLTDLNERQRKGYDRWLEAQQKNGISIILDDETTLWLSANTKTAYHVTHKIDNRRGKMIVAFTCTCEDYEDMGGRLDCKHIFAEKLRLDRIVVIGTRKPKAENKEARRRPARKRICATGENAGKTIRTAQRKARIEMPKAIPQLILSLKRTIDKAPPKIEMEPSEYRGGRNGTPYSTRLTALISKVANGLSCNAMMSEFERMMEDGTLLTTSVPTDNRMSEWLNDKKMTAYLQEALRLSARPFIETEVGAIIDSSKMSQLMTASAMGVDYLGDKRPQADWMKAHMLVGVETMVIMAVEFSGTRGNNTHDINFIMPLVMKAMKMFPLEYVLGDKAYLSGPVLKFLFDLGIKAVIPVKKKHFEDENKSYHQAIYDLVTWFDQNQNRDFHEFYRLRPKVEALFSLMKRLTGGFCWGRGRPRKTKSEEPCTAWKNEVLCKAIYMNLRSTVHQTAETGKKIDYLFPERRFDPPSVPLIQRNVPFKPPVYASM